MLRTGSTDEIPALLGLLEHQRTLHRCLRVLAHRQHALVVADDHQPLLDVLAERQRLVDGLVGLTSKMAPYRQRWTQLYGELDEPTRRRVSALLEEVNGSLNAILQGEGRDTALLHARRETTAQQRSNMDSGRRGHAAYAAGGATGKNPTYAEA